MKKVVLFTAMSAFSIPAYAGELSNKEKSLLMRCESYMAKGDQVSAQAVLSGLASAIRSRNLSEDDGEILADINSTTKECVEFAYGAGARYILSEGKFLTDDRLLEIESDRAAQEALRVAEAEDKIEALQAERQERLMKARIYRKVHESCITLATRDEVAAFTNSLCVESFLANGLPDDL